MRISNFLPEPSPPEPSAFDLFLIERAKQWGKTLKVQWDVLIHFPTFKQNALEEWNFLQAENPQAAELAEAFPNNNSQ